MSISRRDELIVAAYAAPVLREAKYKGHARSIKVVDKDGQVIREMTSIELAERVHERAGIEFDVAEGERRTHGTCEQCGHIFQLPDRIIANRDRRCKTCRNPSQTVCAGFHEERCPHASVPPYGSFTPIALKRRDGAPWRCNTCAPKHRAPRLDGGGQDKCVGSDVPCPSAAVPGRYAFSLKAIRRRSGRPWRCLHCSSRFIILSMTDEQRKNAGKAGMAAARTKIDQEYRKSRSKEGLAARTAEQRAATYEKVRGTRVITAEQRAKASEKTKRQMANLSSEERSRRARWTWEVRRQKAAKNESNGGAS